MIAPPYFQLDERALLSHFEAAAHACEPLPFYVYEFARASGYAVPPELIERLRERVPNLVGMKVSDAPWEAFQPYLLEGLDVFVGPESLIAQGLEHGAVGAVSAVASAFPEKVVAVDPRLQRDPRRDRALSAARGAQAHRRAPRRADPRGRARAAARPDRRGANGARRMARRRIVVAGAGVIGASIAYHLALLGADDVVLCDVGGGRIRRDGQSDGRRAAAVLDRGRGAARAGVDRVLPRARHAVLRPGRLPLPRDDGGGARAAARARRAAARARRAGRGRRRGRGARPAHRRRARRRDLSRGRRRRSTRGRARGRASRRGARGGGARAHGCARARWRRCSSSRAAGSRRELFPELPIRPLVRQLVDVGPVERLPETMPMVVEEETTFHFRRRDACLRLALPRADARGGRATRSSTTRSSRTCASVSRIATRPRPARRSSARGPASTT